MAPLIHVSELSGRRPYSGHMIAKFDRRHFLGLAALACLRAPAARADGESGEAEDYDRASSARRSGKALPLAVLLEKLRGTLDGEIIDVEFDREHGRDVYRLKVVARSGSLRELTVDAASGRIIGGDD